MNRASQGNPVYRYSLAALLTLVAIGVQFITFHGLRVNNLGVLYPIAFLSSWYLGLGPSVLTIFAGALGVYFIFYEPRFSVTGHDSTDYIRLGIFVCASLIVARIIDRGKRAESKFKALQNRFDRAAVATEIGVWYCDVPFGELIWSAKAKEHFWLSADAKIRIEDFNERIHPEDREKIDQAIQNAIERGSPYDVEYRTIRPGHPEQWKWIRSIGWTDRDFRGKAVRFDGISLDVTEQKKNQEELRRSRNAIARSEEQLRLIANRIPAFIAYMDSDGRYQFLNRAYEQWFGVNADETRGKKRSEFVSPETAKMAEPFEAQVLAGLAVRYEAFLKKESGELKYLDVEYVPDFEGGSGKVRGAVLVGHDITQQKEALQAVEFARNELQGIFAQAPLPMCLVTGPEHRFVLANPQYRRLVRREVLGKTLKETFTEAEAGYYRPFLDRVFQTGEAFQVREAPLRLPNEEGRVEDRLLDVGYHPYLDTSGKTQGVFVVIQDVTESAHARMKVEKLAEDLQDAVHARDTFLSIASHELRTPITGMKLQAQLMKRGIEKNDPTAFEPSRVGRLVQQLDRGLDRMARLVEDMLDVSRIESHKLLIQHESVDLGELVKEVLERFSAQLDYAGISCTIEAPSGIVAELDRFRIEQVLTNLITNAIRYAANAPISVRVSRSGNQSVIEFRDRGPGIALQDQERVFQRFERLISASESSGLGLGLYIVREIIRAHGGTIRIESAPGQGTVFIVELPTQAQASG